MAITVLPRPKSVTYFGGRIPGDTALTFQCDAALPKEGYTITLTKDEACVTFADESGNFYAQQTLRQLRVHDGSYPCLHLEDAPQYAYRGFMVDSARHMQTVDELKRFIDVMALFKFNHFHWHLTDDQGWRMESLRYPKLNEISAFRAEDGFGNHNGVRYGGYYTQNEIRDVIAFCAERAITVVPELDVPGHTVSLLAAYPDLSCTGQVAAVSTHAGIHKDVLCVGNEQAVAMVFGLLDEICDLFPGELIHIGGDETPTVRWENCPRCRARMEKQGLATPQALHVDFINRVAAYLKTKGRTAVTWNDTLKASGLDQDVVVADWMDKTGRCIERANAGGAVIEEDFFHYYMDYPYGMTPLRKVYGFDPLRKGLSATGRANILGVETPIWTEFVRDFDALCAMCFPRMLAVAERGWTDPHLLDAEDFKRRAQAALPLLSSLGIAAAGPEHWDPRALGRLGGVLAHYRRAFQVGRENRKLED